MLSTLDRVHSLKLCSWLGINKAVIVGPSHGIYLKTNTEFHRSLGPPFLLRQFTLHRFVSASALNAQRLPFADEWLLRSVFEMENFVLPPTIRTHARLSQDVFIMSRESDDEEWGWDQFSTQSRANGAVSKMCIN
jgi:hypothetical protein